MDSDAIFVHNIGFYRILAGLEQDTLIRVYDESYLDGQMVKASMNLSPTQLQRLILQLQARLEEVKGDDRGRAVQ